MFISDYYVDIIVFLMLNDKANKYTSATSTTTTTTITTTSTTTTTTTIRGEK